MLMQRTAKCNEMSTLLTRIILHSKIHNTKILAFLPLELLS